MRFADIRCPLCSRLLIRHFDGNQVQIDCKTCKIEVLVKRKRPLPVTA